jgi:UDP-GlcNAc:undecaprenyl-phosphate GlcNAc-1-phosphate transferase
MFLLMLIATVVSAGLCLALIPLARRVGLVDIPGARKVHAEPTPLTGGPALLITSGLMLFFMARGNPFIQGLAIGGLLMFVIGLIDDYRPLSARIRFLVQIVACMVIIVYADVRLDDFGRLLWDSSLTLGWLSIPITIFAALGVINSFNMIDGMDGVSGSVFLVAAAGMAMLAGMALQVKIHMLLLVACSAVLGYLLLNARLPWNQKARVFMGDSGSQFLGFFLAWCFIALGSDHNEAGQRAFMPMTAVWLFAVPLLDTTTVMWRRWLAGSSPLAADQHHFHHAFLRAGFTVRQTWLAITGLAILLAVIGLVFEMAGAPDYYSFWTFLAVAVIFQAYIKSSWRLQRFLGRDFIYNEFVTSPTINDFRH